MAKKTKKTEEITKKFGDERRKALDDALKNIEKDFGKGAVMRLGERAEQKVQVMSSGSLALDIALGAGGYPKGRIIEIYGPESLEGHLAGTVFIGIADRNQVRSIKVVIGGRSRSDVRYISTLYAFNLVRQALLQEDMI